MQSYPEEQKLKRIVSNAEIECLGSQMVSRFFRGNEYDTQRVDIDSLVEKYLKLKVVYMTICEDNKDRIGFLSDGRTPLHILERGRVREVCFPENTIVLDRYLLGNEQLTRRRFTLAHEAGHYILNKAKGIDTAGAFNTITSCYERISLHELRETCNLEEIQANRIAAVLLMPENLIDFEMKKFLGSPTLSVFEDNLILPGDKKAVNQIIARMQVSYSAFMNRLKELGRIDWRTGEEYLNLMFEGGMDFE